MEQKSKSLGRVFLMISLGGLFTGLAAELMQRFYDGAFPVGPLFYVVIALAGGWASLVSSPAYGAAGGALAAFLYSLAAGIVFAVVPDSSGSLTAKSAVAAVVVSPVIGALIGVVAGVLVWLVKRGRTSKAM